MKKVCPLSLSEDIITHYTNLSRDLHRSRSQIIDEVLRNHINSKKKNDKPIIEYDIPKNDTIMNDKTDIIENIEELANDALNDLMGK